MTIIPGVGDNVTEEQYLEACREHYRKKMDDTEFAVRQRIGGIAKKLHPTDGGAEYQVRQAISRLLRTKFKLSRLNFISCRDREELLAFLDGLEKLMDGKTE